jgi:hypothetical protein
MDYHNLSFASTYGSNNYNTCTYDGAACTSTGTSTSSGGSLVDTGTAVVAFVTIAVVIIFLALLVRLMKRKKNSSSSPAITGTAETIDGQHRKL